MSQCFGAIAIGWHWLVVDVIHWKIAALVCGQVHDAGGLDELTEGAKRRIRQTIDVDVEIDPSTVRIRGTSNVSANTALRGVW